MNIETVMTPRLLAISKSVPQGAKVEYDNNTATNAGKYAATASISMEGYETLNFDTSDTDVRRFYFNFGKTVNIGVSKNF